MADLSKITLPNNTTVNLKDANVPHSSLTAASSGTDLSLVTTGEKYTWNNKQNALTRPVTGAAVWDTADRIVVTNANSGNVVKQSAYTIATSVPANAVFTDTKYTFTNGGTNKFTVTPSGGTAQDVTFTASDSTRVAKSGDTMTGPLILAGQDLNLGTPSFSSDDSGDIVFKYGNGTEKARIWTSNSYTAKSGLNYRVYNSSGNNVFNGYLGSVSGTITDGQVIIAEGTAGGLKTSGYTIAKSVPSNAVFTDTTYTFANGTNGFTVTPSGGTAQTVTVTPSIANNVTGSGTSGYLTKWNGTNTVTNGPQIGTSTTSFLRNDGTWATPQDPKKILIEGPQPTSYRRGVIALCQVSTTASTALHSYSAGTITFHRGNGLSGVRYISYAIENQYSGAYVANVCNRGSNIGRVASPTLPGGGGWSWCSFKHNDVYYAGIEFYIAAPELGVIVDDYVGNFEPFGFCWYDAQNSTVLDTEFSGSVSYTTPYHAYESFNIESINGVTVGSSPKFTDTTYTLGSSSESITLTPSSGTAQSITTPFATNTEYLRDNVTTTYKWRYINSNDATTWTADTLGATTSLAVLRGNMTGGWTTGHIVTFNFNDVGTPFQVGIHDSSELYFYKRYKTSGTWGNWVKMNAGNADTATKLGTANVGSATNPIYLSAGTATACTYSLGASTNSGTANQLAYYSGANAISSSSALYYKSVNSTATTPATRTILGVYGTTYGNTAANMISGTAGLFSYGDGGPQIDFNAGVSGTQAGALIFTDHDSAAAGASWHFVSNQGDWNVTSKRFHARTGISVGTNLPTTTHNLYVNGTGSVTTSLISPILGVNATNGTSGGVSLYNGVNSVTEYGIAFRTTANMGKHGYVQGDWATYLTMNGADNRGWAFKNVTSGKGIMASISSLGHAVFNGSVTIGGNATNTSGARMEYNTTTQAIDFVFN